jgi:hypothetical protein
MKIWNGIKLLYSEYNGKFLASINRCPECGGMLRFKKKHIKQNYIWSYSIDCVCCNYSKDY